MEFRVFIHSQNLQFYSRRCIQVIGNCCVIWLKDGFCVSCSKAFYWALNGFPVKAFVSFLFHFILLIYHSTFFPVCLSWKSLDQVTKQKKMFLLWISQSLFHFCVFRSLFVKRKCRALLKLLFYFYTCGKLSRSLLILFYPYDRNYLLTSLLISIEAILSIFYAMQC